MAFTIGLKGINLPSAGKQVKTVYRACTHSKLNPSLYIASANIFGTHKRDPDYKRPPPYPYKTKNYGLFQRALDRTTYRFDDNTKLIVVEGPVAVGKTEFAKKLAEDLDMLHLEDATMDTYYINPYGFDFRTLNDELPPAARSFDETDFCKNPMGLNAASFQIIKYKLRFALYIDALAHILSTGQGVVLERSPYTDIAFAEAMLKSGFMGRKAYRIYEEIRRHTLFLLMKPHLVLYLDMPVPVVLQRIKERDLPHERNSPALTETFLTDMEMTNKAHIVQQLSKHAEILMYDWTEGGDIDVVIEDIEKIDFDSHSASDPKMLDWRQFKEKEYCELRQTYADKKHYLMTHFNLPLYDAPELTLSGEEHGIFSEMWLNEPRAGYALGMNKEKGDKNIFWKTKPAKYWDPIG